MAQESVSQTMFLETKERLDGLRLPTIFPIEATPLLRKLLAKISVNPCEPATTERQKEQPIILDQALKLQMGRVVRENNQLHMDLIAAKQQVQSLSHCLQKTAFNKENPKNEQNMMLRLHQNREKQLTEQITQLRFKYNELMDLIHSDNQLQRQYLKRLLKYKQIEGDIDSEGHSIIKEKKKEHGNKENGSVVELQEQISHLRMKLINREKEILRLQRVTQFDGINMNKIIKDFNDTKTKSNLSKAEGKIQLLEKSNEKLTNMNKSMKDKGGLKEALRIEVQNNHKRIKQLLDEINSLKRSKNQIEFDAKKKVEKLTRKMEQNDQQRDRAYASRTVAEEKIGQLVKKLNFVSKEAAELKSELERAQKQVDSCEEKLAEQDKAYQSKRMYYEYELQMSRQKMAETLEDSAQLKTKCKQALDENCLLIKEQQLKSQAIQNLQKIVDELMRKQSHLDEQNSNVISGHPSWRTEQIELKRQLVDLKQQLIHQQNQQEKWESQAKRSQARIASLIKENDKIVNQVRILRQLNDNKDEMLRRLNGEIQVLKQTCKKEQYEGLRNASKLSEAGLTAERLGKQLQALHDESRAMDKANKHKINELEIVMSELEGMLSLKDIRLEERQNKISLLQSNIKDLKQRLQAMQSDMVSLEQQNHELSKEKHRLLQKNKEIVQQYDLIRKQSTRNMESAVNEKLSEVVALKRELMRVTESNERVTTQLQECNGIIMRMVREKQQLQEEKVILARELDHCNVQLGGQPLGRYQQY